MDISSTYKVNMKTPVPGQLLGMAVNLGILADANVAFADNVKRLLAVPS